MVRKTHIRSSTRHGDIASITHRLQRFPSLARRASHPSPACLWFRGVGTLAFRFVLIVQHQTCRMSILASRMGCSQRSWLSICSYYCVARAWRLFDRHCVRFLLPRFSLGSRVACYCTVLCVHGPLGVVSAHAIASIALFFSGP